MSIAARIVAKTFVDAMIDVPFTPLIRAGREDALTALIEQVQRESNALSITEREKFERAKQRHEKDATLRDIDHASSEWQTHRDRSNLIDIINRLLRETK